MAGRIGSIVYIDIKNTHSLSAEIHDIEIKQNSKLTEVSCLIHNNGNVMLKPSGKLKIFNANKHLIYKNDLKISPVLPGDKQKAIIYIDKQNKASTMEINVDYGGKKFAIASVPWVTTLLADQPVHIDNKIDSKIISKSKRSVIQDDPMLKYSFDKIIPNNRITKKQQISTSKTLAKDPNQKKVQASYVLNMKLASKQILGVTSNVSTNVNIIELQTKKKSFFAGIWEYIIKLINDCVDFLLGKLTFASNALAFSVNLDSPSISLTLSPGETYRGSLVLSNKGDRSATFRAYVNDWSYLPDGSKQFVAPGTTKYSCASWIKLSEENISIESGKDKKVNYEITVPKYVSGGYYSVVFFESFFGVNKDNINLAGRIGSIVYLKIKKTEKPSVVIQDLKIKPQAKQTEVSFVIENNGNISLKPTGLVKFLDFKQQSITENNIFVLPSLPGDKQTVSLKVANPKHATQVEVSLDYGGKSPVIASIPWETTKSAERRIQINKLVALPSNQNQVKVFTVVQDKGTQTELVTLSLNVYKNDALLEAIPITIKTLLKPEEQIKFQAIGKKKFAKGEYLIELVVELADGASITQESKITIE